MKKFMTVYFLFYFCMLFDFSASAYIDPATTAMLTQVIAGVFITLGVVIGVFRRKIIMFFKNISVNRTKKKIEKEAAKKEMPQAKQEEKQEIKQEAKQEDTE